MNHFYILLVVWQILRTESAVISTVETLNLNDFSRYERSANTNLKFDSNCDAAYKNITSSHSMCLVDVGTEVPLTQAEKDGALATHNNYRKNVSPKATNMQKMVWDDELAKIATKWAQQCKVGHDSGKSRRTLKFKNMFVGQNMAAGQADLNAAIKAWHGEVVDFKYGVGSINTKEVGHYTQVVHHKSSRVGCGKASCPKSSYKIFYMCNYAIGQDIYKIPYKSGTKTCSDCPTSCKDNLCDCGGKLCLNTGTLDINTCTCSCPSLYSGDQCQTLQCKKTEKFWCKKHTAASCTKYSNFPIECHMMCGVCPYPCAGIKCANGGTVDINTCKCSCKKPYTGPKCTKKDCPGTEKSWCNRYTVADCTKYSNFPSDCNIMCGICPKPCAGKKCENSGTLDVKTCKCSCKSPYTGPTCTEKDCPGKEQWWCTKYYTVADCTRSNFPFDCNIMCGVCPKPCAGKKCENSGTLDVKTCKCSCKSPYTGPTCTEKDCPGTEKSWCNRYTVADCLRSNFPSDCNIMCGICPKPCAGKKCENSGTLDVKTCKCSCKSPYTGPTCTETCAGKKCENSGFLDVKTCKCSCLSPYTGPTCTEKDCQGKEASWCNTYPVAFCTKYSDFPIHCNIMCGVCPQPE